MSDNNKAPGCCSCSNFSCPMASRAEGEPSDKDTEFLQNQPYYGDNEQDTNTGKYFLLSAAVLLIAAVIISVCKSLLL